MVQLYIVKASDTVAVLLLVSDHCASLEGTVSGSRQHLGHHVADCE